jgi:hypothetical protein
MRKVAELSFIEARSISRKALHSSNFYHYPFILFQIKIKVLQHLLVVVYLDMNSGDVKLCPNGKQLKPLERSMSRCAGDIHCFFP